MAEIAAIPWNGFKVISTFSGCGGSSLGYKMAGFKVAWANEFIPAAQDTYRLNAPDTILDTRDIRQLQPEEVLEAIELRAGELDIMDGSPPCAAFSTAGKREAGWGKEKKYSDTKQRVDDLFFEYARLLRGIQPKVFIADNVSGLIKGTAKGYFKEILAALKDCGYNVKAQVLDAQWLGVPQSRQRLIFIGVRSDLGIEPAFPKPLSYRYSVREAIPWIGGVSCLLPGKKPGMKSSDEPCATVTVGDTGGNGRHQVRVIHDTGGQYSQGDITDRPCPAITIGVNGLNSSHYLITQPPVDPATDISRFAIGKEALRIPEGGKSQKYLSLTRAHRERPCPTITQTNGSAAGVIHPTECRRFTIAELRRICAFPDDFILTGTYAQQWERLGRAVPPLMMKAIAATVRDEVLCKIR
jgi:DNA (cytosine-5)-methyltransferase 1